MTGSLETSPIISLPMPRPGSGNELSRKGLARVRTGRGRTPGLVVHYDIMRPYARRLRALRQRSRHQGADFSRHGSDGDDAGAEPRGAAGAVPQAGRRQGVEWWDRKRWTRPLKRKIREALYRLTGKKPKLLKEEQLRLLGLYASKNGLKRWLAEWESFLDSLRRDLPDVHLVYVTPHSSRPDHPCFRLLWRS
jgi:hypothetical protein